MPIYPELAHGTRNPSMTWNGPTVGRCMFFPISASETPMEQDSIHCSQNTQLPPDKTDTISSQSHEPESLQVRNAKFQLQSQSRVSGIP